MQRGGWSLQSPNHPSFAPWCDAHAAITFAAVTSITIRPVRQGRVRAISRYRDAFLRIPSCADRKISRILRVAQRRRFERLRRKFFSDLPFVGDTPRPARRTDMIALAELGVRDAAAAIGVGEITAEALAEALLKR